MLTDAGCWVLIAKAATECFWMVLNYATNPLTENIDTSWQEATVRVQYDPEIANCWLGFNDQDTDTQSLDVSSCEYSLEFAHHVFSSIINLITLIFFCSDK